MVTANNATINFAIVSRSYGDPIETPLIGS
jgi:hypothetical protein